MLDYINSFISLYIDMAFYMMIGLVMVGLMKMYLSPEIIGRYIGDNSLKSVFIASALGVPLPLCSCGVLPSAIELKKSGAGIGATTSFLISTPQTGVDSIIATYGMMGPFMAVFRPIAAFISGILGGLLTGVVCRGKRSDSNKEISEECGSGHICCDSHSGEVTVCFSCNSDKQIIKVKGISKLKLSMKYAITTFVDDIAFHFLIGVAIAALITVLIPDDYFANISLNNSFLVMLLMIVIGLPMYICSTSSIPIAIALILKGISPGAAFVFLFVGPVTNIASIILLVKTMGKRATIMYIISVIVMSISFGLLLDGLTDVFDIQFRLLSHDDMSNTITVFMKIASIIFTLLLGISIIKKIKMRARGMIK